MRGAWLLAAGAATFWAVACSSGGSTVVEPPPNNGFSNSSLSGQYAFSMSGTDASNPANPPEPFARVGSFIADGKGDITGGSEDVTIIGTGSNEFAITGGNYTVNSDGRGTLSLIDSSGTLTFNVTMASSTNGYLMFSPTNDLSTASGSFIKQNTASFNLSGLSGSYAFDFSGVDPTGAPESIVGQLIAAPGASVGQFSGVADDNDGGEVNGGNAGGAAISGSYGAPATSPTDLANFGRVEFAIGGVTGFGYIVGPNQVKFLETTSGGTLAGDAFLQSNIPTSAAGVSGPFVYVMGGSTVSTSGGGPLARGGKFSASGGNLSSVIVDTNNAGQQQSLPTSGGPGTGTYTLDPTTGRGTMTFTLNGASVPFNYVFYMVSPTQAFLQEQTSGPNGAVVEDGSMYAQGSETISASSLAGNYALNWSGVAALNGGNAVGEEDVIGQTTLSSGGALTGNVEINEFATGAQTASVPMSGTLTLSSDPTSHNALTFNLKTNPSGQVTAFAYIAANNNILFMTTESNRIAAGVLTLQAP